jgi:hypothetical protein
MEQFNVFLTECISNETTNNKMCRNDIYDLYGLWHCNENRINKKPFIIKYDMRLKPKKSDYCEANYKYNVDGSLLLDNGENIYGKIIGRVEFYKLLIEKYGQPRFINKKTKQYLYCVKKL